MSIARDNSHFPQSMPVVARQLDRVWQQLRKSRALAACQKMAVVTLLALACLLLADGLFHWSTGLRIMLWCLLVLGISVLGVTRLLLPWLRRPEAPVLAAVVEECTPGWNERLLTLAQMSSIDSTQSARDPLTLAIYDQLQSETEQKLNVDDIRSQMGLSRAGRWPWVGIALAAALALPAIFYPQTYSLLWQRSLFPWSTNERPTNLWFEIDQPPAVTALGEDVAINALPRWRDHPAAVVDVVYLNWQSEAGETHRRLMEHNRAAGTYAAKIPRLTTDVNYFISAGSSSSKAYRLHVERRPAVTQTQATATPPAYSGQPTQTLEASSGEWQVFEQSRLVLQVKFNKPVAQAAVELRQVVDVQDEQSENLSSQSPSVKTHPLTLNGTGELGELEWAADQSVEIKVIAVDRWGLENKEDHYQRLNVVADQPPSVSIELVPDALEIANDSRLTIQVAARDDSGIAQLKLYWSSTEAGPSGVWELPIPVEQPDSHSATIQHPVDISSLGLTTGSVVTFQAFASDSRPHPGPQLSHSEKKTVRIVARQQAVAAQFQRRIERWQQELNALNDQAQSMQRMNQELAEQAQAAQSEQQREPIQRRMNRLALDEQRMIESTRELADKLANFPLYEKMSQPLRENLTRGLTEASKVTQQAAATSESQSLLAESQQQLADVADQLKASSEDLKQLGQLERDLQQIDDLAYAAEGLARQVDNLRQLLPPETEQESPSQQKIREELLTQEALRLAGREAQLSQRLEKLLNDHEELHTAFQQHQLERMKELAPELEQLAELQEMLTEQIEKLPEQPDIPKNDSEKQDDNKPTPPAGDNIEKQSGDTPSESEQENSHNPGKGEANNSKSASSTNDGSNAPQPAEPKLTPHDVARQIEESKAAGTNSRASISKQQSLLQQLTSQAIEQMRSQIAPPSPARPAKNRPSESTKANRDRSNRQQTINARIEQTARNTDSASAAMQTVIGQLPAEGAASAGQQGIQASDRLRTSVTMAQRLGTGLSVPETKIPQELGSQMMSASRALSEARQGLQQFLPEDFGNELAEGNKNARQPGDKTADKNEANKNNPSDDGPSANNNNDNKNPSAENDKQQSPNASDVEQIAQKLRDSAQALKEAQQQLQKRSPSSAVGQRQQNGQNAIDSAAISAISAEASDEGDYAGMTLEEIEQIRARLRAWGQLPEPLRVEIMQGRSEPYNPEYKRLIQRYFEALAPRSSPTAEPTSNRPIQ